MCLAIPGQVIKVNGQQATVKYPTVTNKAFIGDETVVVGDWVMVQMGIIIRRLTSNEALEALAGWQSDTV